MAKKNKKNVNVKAVAFGLALLLAGGGLMFYSNSLSEDSGIVKQQHSAVKGVEKKIEPKNVNIVEKTKLSKKDETAKPKPAPLKTVQVEKESTAKELVAIEGVHYEVLEESLNIPPFNGITISEFFWLGCSHCQNFEPEVAKWVSELNKSQPTVVIKKAVPGNSRWTEDAKVFFAMKELNAKSEDVSKMLSFYQKEAKVNGTLPTKELIKSFFELLELDANKAMALIESPTALVSKMVDAEKEFKKLNQGGVPAFVINGRYKLKFDTARSYDDIYQIINAVSKVK